MKVDRAGHQPRPIFFPLAAAGASFLCYLATLAPGLTWANNGADGGDLISAAATLGVAHPSGYPTYLMLARLVQAFPLGTLALRTNLLSALCAAFAAGLVSSIVSRSYSGPSRFGLAGGLVAGVAFGLSPLLWSQAVITEVHALHALFIAAILYTLPLSATHGRRGRNHLLAGALVGLALGNHLTTALILPPWLVLSAWDKGRLHPARLAWRLAGMAAGLLIYLYIPLRAATHPPINWGNASTLEGLWWVVSGGPYRAMAFGLPTDLVGARVQGWAGLLVAQFGLVGMIAAFYGLFFGTTTGPRVKLVTGWLAAVFSIFAIGYNTADSYAYLLPAFLACSIWLGIGLATALAGFRRRQRPFPIGLTVCGGLVLAIMVNAARQVPDLDASRNSAAQRFGEALMEGAAPAGLIFTQDDRDTFAAWYYHVALGRRPDVAVIVEPLLMFAWYRDSLRFNYPGLSVPDKASVDWRSAIVNSNARPVCDALREDTVAVRCSNP